MKTIPLKVSKRDNSGKGVARKLRQDGLVPAILYGEQTNPSPLTVNRHEFSGLLKKSSSEMILVDLTVEGGDGGTEMALVKDVQHDPLTDEVLHIDFQHISPTIPIRVTVPIHLNGLPDGVKNFGGILQQILREIEVEALPADIPDRFDVDVSGLNIHEAIHVSDLSAERVTIVTAPERTIASVVPPTVIKEVTEAEGEAESTEDAAGAPEVISEKKKEDEEGEGGDKKEGADDK